jgi:hypothetical protein
MSSASSARLGRALARAVRTLAWLLLAVVLAFGSAGLIGQLSHPPGGPARAELTYEGDAALASRLDSGDVQLEAIAADVDQLAGEAKQALEATTSSDPTQLSASLEAGSTTATRITSRAQQLEAALADLPGGEPDAILWYGPDALARRAALLTAIDAASDLAGQWGQVTARGLEAAHFTALIAQHDQTVVNAAAQGRAARYTDAVVSLAQAMEILDQINTLRGQIVSGADPTVLDEWVTRNRAYDVALSTLYKALIDSRGKSNVVVQAAARNEQDARAQLPTDRRAIIVIVAEIAQGGLNQAVVAIDATRGRIDDALAAAPSPPPGSPAPGSSAPSPAAAAPTGS